MIRISGDNRNIDNIPGKDYGRNPLPGSLKYTIRWKRIFGWI